jgi:uric acid transporter
VLITRFVRGFFAQIAVLTGLVVGALVAIPMGLTDFSRVASAPWFGMAQPFPDTIFAQNVGLVQLTGVRSRFVPAVAGAALLLLGLVPKFGEAVASLPGPVVGGAGLVMFAMVTAVGIRTLHKVEFDGTNNIMIVAVALGIGMLPVVAPVVPRAGAGHD